MGCALSGCSMIKKGLMGAALSAGALYLAFGTSAPSYVKTAFHRVRESAKSAVSPQFEIDRAREQVASLEPAIKENIAAYAQAEVEIKTLEREIVATRENIDKEKKTILALNEGLKNGEVRLAGNITYTADEVKADLARRYDHYKIACDLLKNKEETLKAKQKTLSAARLQLQQMASAKKDLLVKIEGIEARLHMIETTRSGNDFNFDESALSQAKQTVAELEKRLDVMTKVAEYEGKYSEGGAPIVVEPHRDIVNEIEADLGSATKPAKTDKSL